MLLGLPLALLLLASRAPGAPQRASWRLEWVGAASARGCPSEREVRSAIAERLGYDPFRPDGARSIALALTERGAGYVVDLSSVDETGAAVSKRLESSAADCSVIAAATTLVAGDLVVVAGGFDPQGTATESVEVARIGADGSLGAWASGPALPAPLVYHVAFASF